jgi:hypothetical protein
MASPGKGAETAAVTFASTATVSETVAPVAVSAPKTVLVNAGESTNPVIHALIAELNTARSNGDEAAVADFTKTLETFGYRA